MSLFTYIIDLPNQKGKEGRITAKAEADARDQIVGRYPDGTNLILEAQPVVRPAVVKKAAKKAAKKAVKQPANKAVKQPAKKAAKKAVKKKAASGLTKLQKMLYLQSGKCFFCGEELPLARATIEHLHPKSKGGPSSADNEVVCCAELNHAFGDMELKRKFEFVLKSAGNFKCPKGE